MLTIVDDKNLGFALGAVDYFTKPIDWHRLTAVLKKHRARHARKLCSLSRMTLMPGMLRRSLEKEGWIVTEAENGRRALEWLYRPGFPR